MNDKKQVRGEIARCYQKAGKKGRGKLPAPMLRLMPDFPAAEYELTPDLRDLPASVSPCTIDRILKPVKDKGRLRGMSLTKPDALPRDQIPVRVMFNRDGRKPGFFEFDRVAHCGSDASGQFCQTLTGTDAGSGWTEEHALLNSAHRRVKERVQQIRDELPFPLRGVDSDNGGIGNEVAASSTTSLKTGATSTISSLPGAAPTGKTTIVSWNRNRKPRFRRRCGAQNRVLRPV
jgi:hypothetical protein